MDARAWCEQLRSQACPCDTRHQLRLEHILSHGPHISRSGRGRVARLRTRDLGSSSVGHLSYVRYFPYRPWPHKIRSGALCRAWGPNAFYSTDAPPCGRELRTPCSIKSSALLAPHTPAEHGLARLFDVSGPGDLHRQFQEFCQARLVVVRFPGLERLPHAERLPSQPSRLRRQRKSF